jgi:hypothetical protein
MVRCRSQLNSFWGLGFITLPAGNIAAGGLDAYDG